MKYFWGENRPWQINCYQENKLENDTALLEAKSLPQITQSLTEITIVMADRFYENSAILFCGATTH